MGKVTDFLWYRFEDFNKEKNKSFNEKLDKLGIESDFTPKHLECLGGALTVKDLSHNMHSKSYTDKIKFVATGVSSGKNWHAEDDLFEKLRNKYPNNKKLTFSAKISMYIPYSPCSFCYKEIVRNCNLFQENHADKPIYFRFYYDTLYAKGYIKNENASYLHQTGAKAENAVAYTNKQGAKCVKVPSKGNDTDYKDVPFILMLHYMQHRSLSNI